MITPKVFDSEYNFCLVLWECEPITASDIAKICKERLKWSRTTTYTVIQTRRPWSIKKNKFRGNFSLFKRTNSTVGDR